MGLKAYASGGFCPIVASYFFFTSTFYFIRNGILKFSNKMEYTIIVCYKYEVIFTVDLLHTLAGAEKLYFQKETEKRGIIEKIFCR